MSKKANFLNSKLATFSIAAASFLGLSSPDTLAQKNESNNNKDINFTTKIVNVIAPESVSFTFGCHHWQGNQVEFQGAFLGDFIGNINHQYSDETVVFNVIQGINDPDNSQSYAVLLQYYNSGNYNNITISYGPVDGDTTSTYYSIHEKNYKELNERKNFTLALGYDLGRIGDYSFGAYIVGFNNSHYKFSFATMANAKKNNLLNIDGLSTEINFGLTTGYSVDEIGSFYHMFGPFSMVGGAALQYDLKCGIGFKVMANPAYITGMLVINIGDKKNLFSNSHSKERTIYSFNYNKLQQSHQTNNNEKTLHIFDWLANKAPNP